MFYVVAVIGVSSSIQPLISYNYGAKISKKLKSIFKDRINHGYDFCLLLYGYICFIMFKQS